MLDVCCNVVLGELFRFSVNSYTIKKKHQCLIPQKTKLFICSKNRRLETASSNYESQKRTETEADYKIGPNRLGPKIGPGLELLI